MVDTLAICSAIVTIVGVITWGCNSCSQQETAIREACIRSGGSVIVTGDMSSHCVRSGVSSER